MINLAQINHRQTFNGLRWRNNALEMCPKTGKVYLLKKGVCVKETTIDEV